jgi:predicted amidohydrolase YtcJ
LRRYAPTPIPAAWASAEEIKGRLAPGMLADPSFSRGAFFDLIPAGSTSRRVLLTVFNGRIVYTHPGIDSTLNPIR